VIYLKLLMSVEKNALLFLLWTVLAHRTKHFLFLYAISLSVV
jgi:hypothetical protein